MCTIDSTLSHHDIQNSELRLPKKPSIKNLLPPVLFPGGRGQASRVSPTVTEQTRELLGWAGRCCHLERLVPQIYVDWNYRFTAMLGRATFKEHRIELAAKLWPFLLPETRDEVLIHEACHLFAHEKYNGKTIDHGEEWKELMRVCGYSDPAPSCPCPAPTIAPQYLVYCHCKTHFITPQMRGRLKKGAELICKECKSAIKLEPYGK
jgi:predicted SprT family Zn-dependent metalloprotease